MALESQPCTRQRAGSHWKEEARATPLLVSFRYSTEPRITSSGDVWTPWPCYNRRLPAPSDILDKYQNAAEARLDALFAFGARIHTDDPKEYARLRKLVGRCKDDLLQAQREFERVVPEDLKRSG